MLSVTRSAPNRGAAFFVNANLPAVPAPRPRHMPRDSAPAPRWLLLEISLLAHALIPDQWFDD